MFTGAEMTIKVIVVTGSKMDDFRQRAFLTASYAEHFAIELLRSNHQVSKIEVELGDADVLINSGILTDPSFVDFSSDRIGQN